MAAGKEIYDSVIVSGRAYTKSKLRSMTQRGAKKLAAEFRRRGFVTIVEKNNSLAGFKKWEVLYRKGS